MAIAFSDDWARAWGRALNDSPEYRAAAMSWEGSIAAIATAERNPSLGVYLDVWHGDCRVARVATPDDVAGASYLLEGTPTAWRELFEGRLAPVLALVTGKIQLQRGELARLLPFSAAAKELIRLAGTLETEFPPGW